MSEFKGLWISYDILTNDKLSDKEKLIYSMIVSLSKESDCTMSNGYIGKLLGISNVQVSRIVNSLKKKGYIKTELKYKNNSKEIALRKSTPIIKNDNTYYHIRAEPINKNDKDIKYNYKIEYKRKNFEQRDYSNLNWEQFYANK